MALARRQFLRGGCEAFEPRPPWLLDPATFVEDCTRCGACLEHCPESILVKGDGGFPRVDFSRGECTFCGDCTGHCEANLFHADLEVEAPWQYAAAVDSAACLAQQGVMCRSCEDSCEPQAIRFPLVAGRIPVPVLDAAACTGCGACVSHCPSRAIAVSAGA